MAKRDFLDNFRVARNLFVHPRVTTDSQHLDPPALARTLARAAIWLTPSSVEGFHVADFPELGPDRQRELDEAIQEFESVARQVGPTQPATDAQYQAGVKAFEKILPILEPYLPTRQEAIRIREALRSVDFPSPVVNWDYELGSDADGMPAVWVTVFIDESSAGGYQLGRLASELTAKCRRALSTLGIPRWPYVQVRTVAEHMAR